MTLSIHRRLLIGCALCAAACSPASLQIEEGSSPLTMINVWTPLEGTTVAELAEQVAIGIDDDIRAQDGFLIAAVHQSTDESNVLVYGQWEGQADLEAAGAAIEAGDAPDFSAALALGSYDPRPYRVDVVAAPVGLEIASEVEYLTMVNTWTPFEGVSVDDVASALSAGIVADTAVQPGAQAFGVHASLDGSNVMAYGQWDDMASVEAYGDVIAAGGAPTFAQVFAQAESEAHPYRVTAVID